MKKKIPPKIIYNNNIDNEKKETDSDSDDNSILSSSSNDNLSVETIDKDDFINLSEPHIDRETIEKIAGRKVKQLFYYRRALVHKSIQGLIKNYTNDDVQEYMEESNERLEFLGDSFFNTIVTEYLFNKFPEEDEGFLTKTRTRIIKGTIMAKYAEELGMKDHILMSKFVINAGGKDNKRFLEDAFEAFVGAMLLDLGYEDVKDFSLSIINKFTDDKKILKDDNYKDLLLRFCQYKKMEIPIYDCTKEEGPPHKKLFTIEVKIYGKVYGISTETTKKKAEQDSARQAVDVLGITEESFNT